MTNDPLRAIRERAESDFIIDPESIVPGLAQDLMRARIDRKELLRAIDIADETAAGNLSEMGRLAQQRRHFKHESERLTALLDAPGQIEEK